MGAVVRSVNIVPLGPEGFGNDAAEIFIIIRDFGRLRRAQPIDTESQERSF